MSQPLPTILALDFDGVCCDGMQEYFQSSILTYQRVWRQDLGSLTESLEPNFCQLRPVIETGWEMPVLVRALILGVPPHDILESWQSISKQILESESLDYKLITQALDGVRDNWIQTDLDGWLRLHRFYPGVINKIKQVLDSDTKLYIVTTKGTRFVQQLLQREGVILPENSIFGKEVKRPKPETLKYLLKINDSEPPNHLWFVEDFLKPLQLIKQQPELQGVGLYLANWGYNTQQIRDLVKQDKTIKLLSLEQFNQDFIYWL